MGASPCRGDGARLTEPEDPRWAKCAQVGKALPSSVYPCSSGWWQRRITQGRAEGDRGSRGKRPWGDEGSTEVAGTNNSYRRGDIPGPQPPPEVWEGRPDWGASGLAEPHGPRMSWGRRMAAVTLVTGGDHPEVARTPLGLWPFPGLRGQEKQSEKGRFVLPGRDFLPGTFWGGAGPACYNWERTNGPIFCSTQPFPEPFQPGPPCLQV